MKLLEKMLNIPVIWDLSQKVFGCDPQKKKLYRSVFKEKGKLLDFGCADGNTFPAFSDFEYYGIDINGTLIENAKKKYGSYENANFVHADMLKDPFPAGSFDYVLFSCTGHHLEDKVLFPVMKALAKVLKTGGRLYFFDTIKRPGKDSWLLRCLISMDQGKFMRNEEIYRNIIGTFSPDLKPVEVKTMQVTGTLFPQPRYFYAELERI